MLDSRGRVRLADFGIAAVRHRTDELAGTPAYMAPELFRGGTASAASDVFALGLVLWEIFTGRRPASSDLQDLAAGAEEGAAPAGPAGDLDAQTRRILALCLSADPPARPPAAWIAAALGGDDALRASMAAGHTPSPQAIALAGRSGAFDLRLAGACLAATVILMALAYHVSARISLAASVPLTNSPAALQFQAREHLRLLGVPDPGGHWASGFHLNGRVVNIVAALPPAEQATILATPGTKAVVFWYRARSAPLVPHRLDGPDTRRPAAVRG